MKILSGLLSEVNDNRFLPLAEVDITTELGSDETDALLDLWVRAKKDGITIIDFRSFVSSRNQLRIVLFEIRRHVSFREALQFQESYGEVVYFPGSDLWKIAKTKIPFVSSKWYTYFDEKKVLRKVLNDKNEILCEEGGMLDNGISPNKILVVAYKKKVHATRTKVA